MTYGSIIFGQSPNVSIRRIEKIQNKAIGILNFASFKSETGPLYKKSKIIRFSDHVKLQNFFLVHDDINKRNPFALQNTFKLAKNMHKYSTRGAVNSKVILPGIRKQTYGKFSISYQAAIIWNIMVSKFKNDSLHLKNKVFCKNLITNYLFNSY